MQQCSGAKEGRLHDPCLQEVVSLVGLPIAYPNTLVVHAGCPVVLLSSSRWCLRKP